MTMQRNRGHAAHRIARLAAIVGLLVLAMGAPSVSFAQTAMHEISWAYAAPQNVSHFVVYVSPQDGNALAALKINVGKPPSQLTSGGTMHVFRAIVTARLTDFVAVAAVGSDGRTSPLSAWSALPPSQPGQPLLVP